MTGWELNALVPDQVSTFIQNYIHKLNVFTVNRVQKTWVQKLFFCTEVHIMLHTLIQHLYPVAPVCLLDVARWLRVTYTFSGADVGASSVLQGLITMQHTQLSALTLSVSCP